MKLFVSGSSGFIGKRLTRFFTEKGWQVEPITRDDIKSGREFLSGKIGGSDAVIHLSGAPIIKRKK